MVGAQLCPSEGRPGGNECIANGRPSLDWDMWILAAQQGCVQGGRCLRGSNEEPNKA